MLFIFCSKPLEVHEWYRFELVILFNKKNRNYQQSVRNNELSLVILVAAILPELKMHKI